MRSLLKFFYILALLLLRQIVYAQQDGFSPVYNIIEDTAIEQELGIGSYQILEDKAGKWSIEDVSKTPLSNQFHVENSRQKGTKVKGIYWIRYRLKNTMDLSINIVLETNSEYNDYYLFQNSGKPAHLITGSMVSWEERDGLKFNSCIPVQLAPGKELSVYQRSKQTTFAVPLSVKIGNTEKIIKRDYIDFVESRTNLFGSQNMVEMFLEGILVLVFFYNLSFYNLTREREYLYFSLFIFFLGIGRLFNTTSIYLFLYHPAQIQFAGYLIFSFAFISILLVQFVRTFFKTELLYKSWDRFLVILSLIVGVVDIVFIIIDPLTLTDDSPFPVLALIGGVLFSVLCLSVLITFFLFLRRKDRFSKLVIVGGFPLMLFWVISFFPTKEIFGFYILSGTAFRAIEVTCTLWFVVSFSLILFKRFNYLQKENAQQALDNERLAKEKEIERSRLIEQQKWQLEKTVEERTAELKQSLQELKSTQAQLIQSEKMASLGQLTAGIAHEIQNPLNFVNNFSEINKELIEELRAEKDNPQVQEEIIDDIEQNLDKIIHHGKRADSIVKGMLQHSRASTGKKELTDINALVDECVRLSFHGLRAKDKAFNAEINTSLDNTISKINVVPQDISRVLLNLFNNAFYAVDEKKRQLNGMYVPIVSVCTKKLDDKIEIQVKDNGNGIPQSIVDKIFQPFFTTKPTGQGTGLGLSLSYDIIKAHGGEIRVESKEGEGSEFIIKLSMI